MLWMILSFYDILSLYENIICSCLQASGVISFIHQSIYYNLQMCMNLPPRWRSQLERSSRMQNVGCSNSNRDRPKVVPVTQLKARQHELVSRVIEIDHF